MNENDLDIAYVLEEMILLGNRVRLSCNCILEVLCTMPCTLWRRILRYEHRCPRHPKGGGNHLLLREPAWITLDGELVEPSQFSVTFLELANRGRITLVPGICFDYGKKRHPSVISFEGKHYIAATGRTEKIEIPPHPYD